MWLIIAENFDMLKSGHVEQVFFDYYFNEAFEDNERLTKILNAFIIQFFNNGLDSYVFL